MDENYQSKLTIDELLEKLSEKYEKDGLSLRDHLEGLLHHSGVHYWDYISADTLLSLQKPLTGYPNEVVFITYHQICELYFKLIIHELSILTNIEGRYSENPSLYKAINLNEPENWISRLRRIRFYFMNLTDSFKLMNSDLFEPEEFVKFRLSLIPASGFQTAQFREIEIMMTDLENLQYRGKEITSLNYRDFYRNIYWKVGGLQTRRGEDGVFEPVYLDQEGKILAKTKTLVNFEAKYDQRFQRLAGEFRERNLYHLFFDQADVISENVEIRELLSDIDRLANKEWKGNHFKVISSHLKRNDQIKGNDDQGTGGTNWENYLPPFNQQIKYFPELSTNWQY